ncbi:hypothetical protein ZYGR_0AG01180 [Zygosaccharomyces rouxii]|uniref:Uncharacterized protein n=1 Tax=Zygosaccharomyces rouxii TaxID=4956 RepID=A0A1Q3A8V8_ZYGRO|nr:hypothetical protein ZYGR_0AG01180 [Zygosaccharomyces rouxii]
MTVSKSAIPSLPSANLSIVGSHPHPPLRSHHLKNQSTVSTSVTKATVDTTSTATNTSSQPSSDDKGDTMAVRELAAAASSAAHSSNGSSESGSPGPDTKSSSLSAKNPSSWDPQDDILLRHLKEIRKLGWKDISQYFNNRTPNACQFRWRRLKSGNLKTTKSSSETESTPAGVQMDDPTAASSSSTVAADAALAATTATAALNASSQVKQEDRLSPAIPIPNGGGSFDFHNAHNHRMSFGQSPYSQSPFSGVPYGNSTPTNNFNNNNNNNSSDSNGNVNHNNDNGAGSNQPRGRSHSHSFSKPFNTTNSITAGSGKDETGTSEDENIGFIPKIIVRSRRSSFVHPQSVPSAAAHQPHQQQYSLSQSLQQTPSHLSSAFNTTLNTTKSRKNSFTSRSRRSSFSVAGSATPSRRSSIIAAPNSLSGMFGSQTGSSTPKLARRDSVVKKDFYSHRSASVSASFMDLPPAAASIAPPTHRRLSRTHCKPSLSNQLQQQKWQQPQQLPQYQQHLQNQKNFSLSDSNGSSQINNTANTRVWSTDEDQLLSEKGSRNLSLMELSILLPNRSEQEIQWRLDTMFSDKSPTASNENSQSPYTSPRKSVTPEDTAIDEDTCDERDQADDDDDEIDNMSIEQVNDDSSPTFTSKEATPASVISSTTTKEDDQSDASSSRSRNRSENMAKNTLGNNFNIPNGASRSSAYSTTLPSINAILKESL